MFLFSRNPDVKEFIAQAGRVYRHNRERYVGSGGSGEAGHSVGMHMHRRKDRSVGVGRDEFISQRKPRRVPGYETESHFRPKEE